MAEELSALLDDESAEFSTRRILKEMELNGELQEKWDRYCLVRDVLKNNAGTVVANLEADETPESLISDEAISGLKARAAFGDRISKAIDDERTYNMTSVAKAADTTSKEGNVEEPGRDAGGSTQTSGFHNALPSNITTLPHARPRSMFQKYGAVASVGFLMVIVWQLFQFNDGSKDLSTIADVALNDREAREIVLAPENNDPTRFVSLGPVNKQNVAVPVPVTQSRVIVRNGAAAGPNKLEGYFRIHSEQSALGSSRGMMPYARAIHFREIR